jgi:NAD(P)-dependent dehydrogenase (short-subunit alcohol dehydrogenase family)
MPNPLFDMTGRVALVSGAAQNLGRNSALALAEAGADLLIADINGPGVERTAEEIRSMGRRAIAITCDVTDEAQIRAMFRRLDEEFGRIDVVANIPGAAVGGHPEDLTVENFSKTLQGTLVGKFICCQEAGIRMLAQGKGSIINMSSIGGIRALGRAHLPYSVAQAGVIQMTRELAVEWGDRGVRINAIAPAQMTNPAFEIRMDNTPGLRETYLRGIPLRRLGVPEDIKGLVVFLASDASAFITGAVFPLDGGNTAMGANGTIGRREA